MYQCMSSAARQQEAHTQSAHRHHAHALQNTNDLDGPRLLHHTMANMNTADQVAAFREFTCVQVQLSSAMCALEQSDCVRLQPARCSSTTALICECDLATSVSS